MEPEQKTVAIEKMFDWMDVDKSGKVTVREFKTSLIRAWYCQMPPGILDLLPEEGE